MEKANKEIIKKLSKAEEKSREKLAALKRKAAKEYEVSCPSNVELLKTYRDMDLTDKATRLLLTTRPIRSLSGVVNISVLTKPYECPGECIYCPAQEGAPKSYLDEEPAVMRAKLSDYDPEKQVKARLKALKKTGHPTDKIELRVVGETWSHYEKEYRKKFIRKCFNSLNGEKSESLKEAQRKNEKAENRLVCLSVETRPDYIDKKEIKNLRELGVTMVELGVQSTYDDVLEKNKRGHKVKTTAKATKLLKDGGFKVCYQVMPDLPGSNYQRDLEMFEKLYSDNRFKPDFIKIYPCMVLKEAPLHKLYEKGEYKPYDKEKLTNLLLEIKSEIIPHWTRIQRVIRDIPSQWVVAGGGASNLREELHEKLRERGEACNCIRCREVRDDYDPDEEVEVCKEVYPASDGKEIVLTFENKDRTKLFSLLRMRVPADPYPEELKNSSIIRELHTYGRQISLKDGEAVKTAPQHKGLGTKLVKKAEELAPTDKITVISGVGARGYWRKLNYELKDTYMVKTIDNQ